MRRARGLSERSLNIMPAVTLLVLVAAPGYCQEDNPLSLADALSYALDHNPRLAAAASRVSQTDAGLDFARSRAEPQVAVRASGRLQNPVQEITIPIAGGRTVRITRPDQASASIGVAWPFWTGGRTAAAVGAARAQVATAEADLQQATEQLLYEVGVAYYRVLIDRGAQAEAQAAAARAEEDMRTASVRRGAGVLTAAGVSGAEAALRRANQQLAAATNGVRDAEEDFNRLLARALQTPVVLVEEPVSLDAPNTGDQAVALALTARPELLALEHRREGAEMAIAQARAEHNPTVSAVAQAGWQTPTEVVEAHSESVGIEFSWPILEHSGPEANQRRAAAQVREIEQAREDLESLIAVQVAETRRRVADAREAQAAAAMAVGAATEAAREVRAGHEAGVATRQQLVAAECAAREAEAKREQAEYAVSAALLGYARAMGLLRTLVLVPTEEAVAP